MRLQDLLFALIFAFLALLLHVLGAAAAVDCNSTIAFPAQVKLQLLFPRFIDREASPNFRGHRIKKNDKYFAFIGKESSYGHCIHDIVDDSLKNFCLLRAKFLKANNTHLMLQVSSPNIYDSGCYVVDWMYGKLESKQPERIYVDVYETSPTTTTVSTLIKDNGSHTSPTTTTVSTLIKDNGSHRPKAPAAVSDAIASYSAIKQTLYLYCLLLAIVL